MIWFLFIIPVIAVIFLRIFAKRNMAWWEYILVFVIPALAIVIAKYTSVESQIRDREIWNSYLVKAEYLEPWSTWVHRTCQNCTENCTGTGENRSCSQTCTDYDCSYCDNNGPKWTAYDNIGNSINISQNKFEELCRLWNNRTFVELNRSINRHWSCGQDGDMYVTNFDRNFDHTVPIVTEKSYRNKVQCSRSVFNFQDVDTSEIRQFKLYEYPPYTDRFTYNPVLGLANAEASKKLQQYNGQYGAFKQVHMLLLFWQQQPVEAAVLQQSYWKNGNKNEFILCVGLDGKKIKWTKAITWSEVDRLRLGIEKKIVAMDTLNAVAIVDTLANNVYHQFSRKHFKDFDYLRIDPSPKALLITAVVVLVLTIGLAIFNILNPFSEEDPAGKKSFNPWKRHV